MAAGLAIPVRAVNGRAATSSGEDQMRKIIMLMMGDGESENPYNDEDVGTEPTLWELDGPALRAMVQRKIERHFARLEGADRAQLVSVDVLKAQGGELRVFIHYTDLETDEEQVLDQVVRRA